jgi:SAM-dependent methyltransferase
MNRRSEDRQDILRQFYEAHMEGGQGHYFTFKDGYLQAACQQRGWLKIHFYKARRLLKIKSADCFLDLGCGEGYLTLPLARFAGKSVGLDFTLAALRVLRKQKTLQKRLLYAAVARGDRIPLLPDSIDKAICNHVLEHVLDDDLVVAELHRVMCTGGRLLVGVPLALGPQIRLLMRLRRLLFPGTPYLQLETVTPGQLVPELIGKQSHIRFYNLESVLDLLRRHSFRIVRIEGIGFAMRGSLAPIFRTNSFLLHLGTLWSYFIPSLGDGVFVLAEKV